MRITFSESYNLHEHEIKFVRGTVGIYFIYLDELAIAYPFGRSRLIYIGMSESTQNSIGKRLRGHLTGQSGNEGIRNYAANHKVRFTCHSKDVLQGCGARDLFEMESFFLSSFLDCQGCFPICNGQAGVEQTEAAPTLINTSVDWSFFGAESVQI